MIETPTSKTEAASIDRTWGFRILFCLFFLSGFNALLYQVTWQRMLGLFSGSDVRSMTVVIASYLLGLGLGNFISSNISDRFTSRQGVIIYGCCNLGIAFFAIGSRFLFYDLLFIRLRYLAQEPLIMLAIVLVSLLIPTTMMGLSLPLLSKVVSRSVENASSSIGWLYGVNTLGSGFGTLISGWFLLGTLGYQGTIYLGAFFSTCVGLTAIFVARNFNFTSHRFLPNSETQLHQNATGLFSSDDEKQGNNQQSTPLFFLSKEIRQWYLFVFLSGFAAISWEIIWFRVLDIALQSNAYTYAHLLAFVLMSNGLGSLLGAKVSHLIRQPKKVFFLIQGIVAIYSAIAIWLIAVYWQNNPTLRDDLGYIDLDNLNFAVFFKYVIVPSVMMIVPNLLLGFYFPLVQKAVQQDVRTIGRKVGSILVANILGNTTGSLVTGLILLDILGTSGSIKLLCALGLGFLLTIRSSWLRAKLSILLTVVATILILTFPNNSFLWSALQAVNPNAYFIVAEDSTSVAAIAETKKQGVLLASGQVQAHFPYMHLHGLLGTVPALLHPHPEQIMIIGLGSGGTPHTLGVNPATKQVRVVELLGAELTVLREYAQTAIGRPLKYLLEDPRYQIIIGDGRRELALSKEKFDIIEADAIQPWRSRAGMLYSQEFFQEVRSKLKSGGFFVEWNVGAGTRETMLSVFPYVTNVNLTKDLAILLGSDFPMIFERQQILDRLNLPPVQAFLDRAGINIQQIRDDIQTARVDFYSQEKDFQVKDSRGSQINSDLFPKGEYYLN
jgi:spermidine synthase